MKRLITWVIVLTLLVTSIPITSIEVVAAESSEYMDEVVDMEADYVTTSEDEIDEFELAAANQSAAWRAIEDHIDPEYHLTWPRVTSYNRGMTDEQYQELKVVAEDIVASKDCQNDYDKIVAIGNYVSSTIYYNHRNEYPPTSYLEQAYNVFTQEVNQGGNAYSTYKSKAAVCEGYCELTKTLLNAVGIPCMFVPSFGFFGANHAYNIAYDSQQDTWYAIDTTAHTGNHIFQNTWLQLPMNSIEDSEDMYDPGEEVMASNHITSGWYGLVDGESNSLYYQIHITPNEEGETWSNVEWDLTIDDYTDKEVVKAVSGFAGAKTKGFTKQAQGVFVGNVYAKHIDLSEANVIEVPASTFYGCTNLKTLILSDEVTSIGSAAFRNCASLEALDLSVYKKLVTIETKDLFSGCSSLKQMDLSPFAISALEGYTFEGCTNLKNVYLPETLTSIGDGVFMGCSSLAEIELPSGITSIGEELFSDCESLKRIDLSKYEWEEIPAKTFKNCFSLETVLLPAGITSIGESGFSGCASLKSIDLSELQITEIADNTFNSCESLEQILLPADLNYIGFRAFYSLYALEKLDLSYTKLTKIDESAFEDCWELKEVYFPNTLTTIEESAFCGNNKLQTIGWSDNITNLGDMAFYGVVLYGDDFINTYVITNQPSGEVDTSFYVWGCRNVFVTPQVYKLQFDGNGSTKGSMDSIPFVSDATIVLPDNTFEKSSAKFLGWNTKKDGSGTFYEDGASIDNLKVSSGTTLTLYAQWEKTVFNITYVLNGGKNSSKNPSTYKRNSSTITLAAPTRKGYTFAGWYTDKKCTKEVTQIRSGSTGDKKFYAKWLAKKYKITYKLNGGTNNKSNKTSYYVTSSTITLKTPTRKGYTFKGWYSDSKYKNKITQIKKGSTGNMTLYAKWAKKKYTITYVLNGGKNNKSNKTTYYVTTGTFKLKSPTRKGYVFKGWYSDKKCKKKVTQIKKGSTGNKKLYAKWVKKKK